MDIREFLFYEKMSMSELAEKALITRGFLSRVINRRQAASQMVLERIKKATKGKVPIPEGLYSPNPKTRRKK